MVPVVFLSCATLIGCSDGNTQSELPKQTKQTKQTETNKSNQTRNYW